MGTRALEHGRPPLGLVMELVVGLGAQRTQGAPGLTPRGAPSRGAFPKRLASPDGPRLGHASERAGWEKLGGHGEGGGRRPLALIALLPHITRDARAGRRPVRHDPRGLRDALHAALAAPCVLGTRTSLRDRPLALCGQAWAVATPTAFTIDTMIGMADGAPALCDLRALLGEARRLTPGRRERRLGVLQTHEGLWGAARPAFVGRAARGVPRRWPLRTLRVRFGGRLGGRGLCDGQRR